ncbi:hypothetical protein LCGC14_0594290 [marine sediment metagenome]|uniref:Uncharacterized protein n=1 Tax=marine sediment metagenome TaxID=412755 RepID=A0A0F9RW96_9ZZZZ
MPGRQFNRLPASGPMAQQAEQEYKAAKRAAGEEYEIEARALGQQVLTDAQYQNKMAQLQGKHSLKALQMDRNWDQQMTQINEYEKLGAAGTISPEQADQAQYGISGYRVPSQKQPNYQNEHRNLIQERNRLTDMLINNWAKKWGKWRSIEEINKDGKITKWGDKATPEELQQIETIQNMIGQFDAYEFELLNKLDPQQRKVNQLSRAMSMGPRTQATPGVGGKRPRILLGTGTPEDPLRGYADAPEPERFETPGFKMTREKAITRAREQLGTGADRERIITLAKQIYGAK